MIDFILQSRIKYFVLGVLAIIFFVFILYDRQKFSEDDEIRNYHEEVAVRNTLLLKARHKKQTHDNHPGHDADIGPQNHPPNDWNVQFYSGKQMADEVDSEKQLFQVHTITIENVANVDVELQCKDVFSKFGGKLVSGSQYSFRVTDLLSKRHYWCEAIFDNAQPVLDKKLNPKFKNRNNRLIDLGGVELGKDKKKSFMFKAYGEGAPRDNNHIYLKLDGAFINGENMVYNTKDN